MGVVYFFDYQEIEYGMVVLKLNSINKSGAFYDRLETCDPLIVQIKYKAEYYDILDPRTWRKSWSKFVTKEKHNQAMQILKKAWSDNREIVFGYIGQGLIPLSRNNFCHVEARGLLFDDGEFYAFHNKI